ADGAGVDASGFGFGEPAGDELVGGVAGLVAALDFDDDAGAEADVAAVLVAGEGEAVCSGEASGTGGTDNGRLGRGPHIFALVDHQAMSFLKCPCTSCMT